MGTLRLVERDRVTGEEKDIVGLRKRWKMLRFLATYLQLQGALNVAMLLSEDQEITAGRFTYRYVWSK